MWRKMVVLVFMILSSKVFAQFKPIPPIRTLPIKLCTVSKTMIRNIPYDDHTKCSKVDRRDVNAADIFEIENVTWDFNSSQRLIVYIEDAARPPGSFGVLGYELREVYRHGKKLEVRIPRGWPFIGHTYHVTVFGYGNPSGTNKYLKAGIITVR